MSDEEGPSVCKALIFTLTFGKYSIVYFEQENDMV